MHMNRPLFIAVSAFIVLSACRPDGGGDTERPTIEVLEITPKLAPTTVCETDGVDAIRITVNEPFAITLRFSDDQNLGSAKLNIHNNFDCHTHRSSNVIWEWVEVIELTGTSVTQTFILAPPENVRPGNYHFEIMLLDAVGQEAIPYFFDLVLFDPVDVQAPEINITSPLPNTEHNRSSLLPIHGAVVDNLEMGTGEVEITLIDQMGTVFSVERMGFEAHIGHEVEFATDYFVPNAVLSGPVTLRVQASDWKNNTAISYRECVLVD